MAKQNGVVAQVLNLGSEQAVDQYLAKMRAKYRKIDEVSGKPLYKNNVGVVWRREGNGVLAILSNCAC